MFFLFLLGHPLATPWLPPGFPRDPKDLRDFNGDPMTVRVKDLPENTTIDELQKFFDDRVKAKVQAIFFERSILQIYFS